MNTLKSLINHEHWANHRIIDALREVDGFNEPTRRIFNHLLAAHATWFSRISGIPTDLTIWDSAIDSSEYPLMVDEYRGHWLTLLEKDELNRRISYSNSKGVSFSNSIEEIIMHLSMHGQYHRGQIVALNRPLFNTPPATDFILFLREIQPAL